MAAAIQRGVCLTTSVFAQLPLQSTASIKTTGSSLCVCSRVGLGSSFVPQNLPHEEALCIPVKTRGPGRQSRRPVQALFGGNVPVSNQACIRAAYVVLAPLPHIAGLHLQQLSKYQFHADPMLGPPKTRCFEF
jgi:hypothetical protein